MAFKNLSHFIETLEQNAELVRVKTLVDTNQEITEITDRFSKNSGKALLFENNGTNFPLLINAMGSKKRIEIALGVENIDELGKQIAQLFTTLTSPKENIWEKLKVLPALRNVSSWLPSRSSRRGSCQENEMIEVDLSKLPVLTCWPFDGGPFITFPVVHSIDPEDGSHNMGMYRMQALDNTTTGMHWHLHKGGASHYNKYKKLGKRMPVTVTLGGDPAYTYSATAPLPENIDEFLLAGFLRKKKVTLVKSITNNIYIPEDVDFVLEGYVDTSEDLVLEGPFGDHTGYYSLADYYPKFHVTKITHRTNAVFPATIVGIPPQEDAWIGLATERIFLNPIKMAMVPEIVDMRMPVEGVFHNIVMASIHNKFPGQASKVMNALWGAGQMMFNKILFVFDENVNLTNDLEIAQQISLNVDPIDDVLLSRGPLDVLDHASAVFAKGGKLGIDAMHKQSSFLPIAIVNKIEIETKLPEILEVYTDLLDQDISILLLRIQKSQTMHTQKVAEILLNNEWVKGVKFIVFVEEKAICADYADIVWRCANNIDPDRDCFYVNDKDGFKHNCLILDGTRKNLVLDKFSRDWPNIVCSSQEIIEKVDARWNEYGIGEFLISPSIKYRNQLYKGGAVATE